MAHLPSSHSASTAPTKRRRAHRPLHEELQPRGRVMVVDDCRSGGLQ